MNQVLTIILKETYTKTSLLRRVRLAKDVANFALFHLQDPNLSLEITLEKLLAATPAGPLKTQVEANKDWLLSLGDNFFKQFDKSQINVIFNQIQSEIEVLKSITIYLPFEIYDRDIQSLGQWFKKNVGQEAIFEFAYAPDLIGGCSLSYKGIVKDYSIKTRVQLNRQALIQELQNLKHGSS